MGRKRSFDLAFKLRAVTYAKEHSGEEAARHFDVDPKRIREWRKQMGDIEKTAAEKGASSKRLPGGGAKKVSEELDELVFTWIMERRLKGARVSRKMIRTKAKWIFDTEIDDASKVQEPFVASAGWLDKFMKRHHLSLRRRTSLAQKDPEVMDKLDSFVVWVANQQTADGVKDSEIIGMDETSAWFDMLGSTTVEPTDNRSNTIKTSGHEKHQFTVTLAAKADGTKLKPFIVFRGAKREVAGLQDVQEAVIATSTNGWRSQELTTLWLQKVYCGVFCFRKRLLVWDDCRCHISEETKQELKEYEMSGIPGGWTKYDQPADVAWNKPVKDKIRELYDNWASGEEDQGFTAGGKLKAPALRLLVAWIISAWQEISPEMIRKSLKDCGIISACDGSEDDRVHRFEEGEPCRARRQAMVPVLPSQEEDGDGLANNEVIIIDSDDE